MNMLVMPRENIRKCHLLLEFQSLKYLCFSYFIIKKKQIQKSKEIKSRSVRFWKTSW